MVSASGGCRRAETKPVGAAKKSELVVFAAASLREAFGTLEGELEKTRPDVEVTFNFAGSQELRTQLEHGAVADVFASADQRHMGALASVMKVVGPEVFARNEPVVITPKESAEKIGVFSDFPSASRIVIGVPEVPIGRYTLEILDKASKVLGRDFRTRVEAHVVSRELNVRQVLAKVTLGEADAAVVYRTDAQTAEDRISVVAIPPELNVIAEYPIAVLEGAPHAELARAWLDLVLSDEGSRILSKAGFLPAKSVALNP